VSRDWYRLYIAHAIGGAGQVVMTEDGSAAAVWFDRRGDYSDPEGYEKRLAELAREHLGRFHHLDLQMEASHPTDPHEHLLFLAVHPDRWSQGLGSALMDYTHARLDADGIPAYLEATGEENRKLYRRHGYMDMSPPTIAVSDDTVLYRMWRPARPHVPPFPPAGAVAGIERTPPGLPDHPKATSGGRDQTRVRSPDLAGRRTCHRAQKGAYCRCRLRGYRLQQQKGLRGGPTLGHRVSRRRRRPGPGRRSPDSRGRRPRRAGSGRPQ